MECRRRSSFTSICLPHQFGSGRGKQLALLFQLFVHSGLGFCHFRRICGLVRAIITGHGAETVISDSRCLLKNSTEQLLGKPPAAYPNELQFPSRKRVPGTT